MSSLNYLAITVIALFIYVNGQETEILQQPECELMDPATMQFRICELQRKIEKLELLLINGAVLENHMISESAPLKQKRKNEFIRFGKRKNEFIRFGRSDGENPEELNDHFVSKRKNEFIRFG